MARRSRGVREQKYLVVGMGAMPGNSWEGHTLAETLEQLSILADAKPKMAVVDKGYLNVKLDGVCILRSGQKRRLTRTLHAAEQLVGLVVVQAAGTAHHAHHRQGTELEILAAYVVDHFPVFGGQEENALGQGDTGGHLAAPQIGPGEVTRRVEPVGGQNIGLLNGVAVHGVSFMPRRRSPGWLPRPSAT